MTDIITATKEVLEFSSNLTTWALSVTAFSVVTIISTSYIRPKAFALRASYLLFLPGWLFLAISINCAEKLSRKYLAAIMVSQDNLIQIGSDINNLFADQRRWFLWALATFGAWLVIYLLTWIFSDFFSEGDL